MLGLAAMTEGRIMAYSYSVKQTAVQGRIGSFSDARGWSVIEVSEGDERPIASCRERDDAYTIQRLYTAMEAGEIRLPALI